jgi:hypothetical protein
MLSNDSRKSCLDRISFDFQAVNFIFGPTLASDILGILRCRCRSYSPDLFLPRGGENDADLLFLSFDDFFLLFFSLSSSEGVGDTDLRSPSDEDVGEDGGEDGGEGDLSVLGFFFEIGAPFLDLGEDGGEDDGEGDLSVFDLFFEMGALFLDFGEDGGEDGGEGDLSVLGFFFEMGALFLGFGEDGGEGGGEGDLSVFGFFFEIGVPFLGLGEDGGEGDLSVLDFFFEMGALFLGFGEGEEGGEDAPFLSCSFLFGEDAGDIELDLLRCLFCFSGEAEGEDGVDFRTYFYYF